MVWAQSMEPNTTIHSFIEISVIKIIYQSAEQQ